MSNTNFAFLVLSCDKYSDLWQPYFNNFFVLNPDFPYKVYLGANTKKYNGKFPVETIFSGDDVDWSTSLISILEQIKENYVFILLEDLFLTAPIDRGYLDTCKRFVEKNAVLHLKLSNYPVISDVIFDGFVHYPKGAPYRVTVTGIWNKAFLQRLLIPGENPWNFEIMGSYRASYEVPIYAPVKPIVNIINLVEKGSWMPGSLDWAYENKIEISSTSRPLLAGNKGIISKLQIAYFRLVLAIPWTLRLKIMNKLRRVLVCY